MIFAIGDSHAIFYHNSSVVKEHWMGFKGLAVTMYQFNRSDVDIHQIGTILGNGHEKYNIKVNDIVLFCFGWNDAQKNIKTYAIDYKEEIEKLVDAYITKLKSLSVTPIVNCIYPNPHVMNKNIKGSEQERLTYIHKFNKTLKEKCAENQILFFDIFDFITCDGRIKNEYTKDGIHLDYTNELLRRVIDTKLLDLVNNFSLS